MAKVSKASVNYRPVSGKQPGRRRCGNCSMFVPGKPAGRRGGASGPGACTLVAGVIRARDICDRWEAR